MSIDDFLGDSKGEIVQAITYEGESSTSYENFYVPPYSYFMHGFILIVCLIFLLKGLFSLIIRTR